VQEKKDKIRLSTNLPREASLSQTYTGETSTVITGRHKQV